MDKPGKTQGVSPTLPTGRRLPNKRHSTPQQHGMILISGNGEISSRLHAFSLFLPESCPNNRDHRSYRLIESPLNRLHQTLPCSLAGLHRLKVELLLVVLELLVSEQLLIP
jgi:hypothetical protein